MGQELVKVGKVTHYFPKIKVAVIEILEASIKMGDKITINGHTTNFCQKVDSMQINNEDAQIAMPGQEASINLASPARVKDFVYKYI